MDHLLRRIAYLVEIAARRHATGARVGKTALQKLLYILQYGYGTQLGYRFDLYTYGPYSSEVMGDIDYANATDLLSVQYDGDKGYSISLGAEASQIDELRENIRAESEDKLTLLLDRFGNLRAADLELRATILYVIKDRKTGEDDDDEIARITRGLKPKFSDEEVRAGIMDIRDAGFVQR